MWGARYWGARYWGARYWGKVGATPAALTPRSAVLALMSRTPVLELRGS